VLAIRDPQPLSTPSVLASGERVAAASFATLTPEGHVLTPRLAIVTLLACPPFEPPVPPKAEPPPPPPVTTVPVETAAAAPPEPPPPPPAPAPAPQPSPPAPAPPSAPPPAPPNFAAPAQLSAPNAGIADSPEHQAALSLSASTRLLLGAAAVSAMALATYVATSSTNADPTRRLSLQQRRS
jgi:outer membrane biosynthesis protein TonB